MRRAGRRHGGRKRRRRGQSRSKRGIRTRTGRRRMRRDVRDDRRRRRLSQRSGGGRPRSCTRRQHKNAGQAASTRRSVKKKGRSPRRSCGGKSGRRRDDDGRNSRGRGSDGSRIRRTKRRRDGLGKSCPLRQRPDELAKLRVEHHPGRELRPLARSKADQRVVSVADQCHNVGRAVDTYGKRRLPQSVLRESQAN